MYKSCLKVKGCGFESQYRQGFSAINICWRLLMTSSGSFRWSIYCVRCCYLQWLLFNKKEIQQVKRAWGQAINMSWAKFDEKNQIVSFTIFPNRQNPHIRSIWLSLKSGVEMKYLQKKTRQREWARKKWHFLFEGILTRCGKISALAKIFLNVLQHIFELVQFFITTQ